MKWFKTFTTKDGFITQEWSADEMFTFDMLKYIFFGILLSILSSLASGICLAVRLYDYEEGELAPNVVGIGIGTYFLLDYCFGWPVQFILRLFEDAQTMKIIASSNLAILVAHVVMVLFGNRIYNSIKNAETRKQTFIIYTILFVGLVFFISLGIF